MERPGVGQDREVDVGRDLDAQRHAERANQIEHHLAARRRRLVVPVERAVQAVAGMVIDVDDELVLEPLHAGAAEVAALHHDDGVDIGGTGAARDLDALHPGKFLVVIGARRPS